MRRIKEVIVVEGKYDRNTLSQVVDAVIIETSGFSLFHDQEKRRLLKTLAENRGLIVLTDSDGAGFQIRNYIKGMIEPSLVKHAYIPDVPGKERRKKKTTREGKLGVEGIQPGILLDALIHAGASFEDEDKTTLPQSSGITKADLYAVGLSGKENSADKRIALQKKLGLPERLSAGMLLDLLNILMTREEFYQLECNAAQTVNSPETA